MALCGNTLKKCGSQSRIGWAPLAFFDGTCVKAHAISFREATISRVEKINQIRKQTLQHYCKYKHKVSATKNFTEFWKRKSKDRMPRFYFTDTAKLIFCATAKCGTTQWRNLMLMLDGYLTMNNTLSPQDKYNMSMKHSFLWNKFDLSKAEDADQVAERMQSYYKIFTTREPLERLVSAYRDKLQRWDDPKRYYAIVSKRIHKSAIQKAGRNRSTERQQSSVNDPATFEQFIDHILATKDRGNLDVHWKPYSNLCHPCEVEYHFIAKMETIYDDVTFITHKLGIARNMFGLFNEAGNEDLQQKRMTLYYEYYSKIPSSKQKAIFLYYKDQYDMFGYEYPKFIKMKLK